MKPKTITKKRFYKELKKIKPLHAVILDCPTCEKEIINNIRKKLEDEFKIDKECHSYFEAEINWQDFWKKYLGAGK